MMPVDFKVIFLIVNWNGKEKIRRCLGSLKKYLCNLSYKIVVVDNNSTDGSRELIRSEFPEVILLVNKQNLGFARACNRGLEYIRDMQIAFVYLVFLNNDVELRDSSFLTLIQWMDKRKDVAACSPALLDEQGWPQPGSGGFALSIPSAFYHFFFLSSYFPRVFKGLFFC